MLKKAGAVAAATAGLLMLGAPAFAGTAAPMHSKDQGQIGLVNVQDLEVVKNVAVTAGVCGNNVGVLGAAVPILSPSITHNCASTDIASEDN